MCSPKSSGIPVLTPKSLKGAPEQAVFAAHEADVAVVVAYGLILPKPVLDAPREGCLNLHGSALPRWRGAAPIQRAIMAGDARTAAMVMRMDEGLDTGPICLADDIEIGPNMTAGELHDAMARRGADIMVRALAALERGSLVCTPQPAEGVTYAAKIGKDEARIDFAAPALTVHNRIRGLSPFPGAWFEAEVQGKRERIKVLRCELVGCFWRGTWNAARRSSDGRLRQRCRASRPSTARRQEADERRRTAARFAVARGLAVVDTGSRCRAISSSSSTTARPSSAGRSRAWAAPCRASWRWPSRPSRAPPSIRAGAGRTDAGVHARGQVAHIDLAKDWPADTVREAMNFHLKPDPIAILSAERVDTTFDARFSATARHYRYRLINRRARLALDANRAWLVSRPMDVPAMQQAARALVGHHDFTTFRSAHCQAKSPLRTLDRLDITRQGDDEIVVEASARAFLHNQVRSMVGSLKLVGEARWAPEEIGAALAARDRARCGALAPPAGLYLMQVDYVAGGIAAHVVNPAAAYSGTQRNAKWTRLSRPRAHMLERSTSSAA